MRVVVLVAILLITACGSTAATVKHSPTPSPSPTPDVPALYTAAIQKTHDYLVSDFAAIAKASTGSADEMTAARHLGDDYQSLLVSLDAIPFPSSAQADVSDLKKSVVALQIFWSEVGNDTNSFSSFTETSLSNAYNQTAVVLGHDVGVTLVIAAVSPSPS